MKVREARLSPGHAVIFVEDPSSFPGIPPDTSTVQIAATDSCIAIGTHVERNGATTVRLGQRIENPQGDLAFDGEIQTPGQMVAVVGSDAENILSLRVAGQTARVKVWVNNEREPDLITIQAQ
jgi:hypothetical protein